MISSSSTGFEEIYIPEHKLIPDNKDPIIPDLEGSVGLPTQGISSALFEPHVDPNYEWKVNHKWGTHYFSSHADWGASVKAVTERYNTTYDYTESLESMYWWGDLYNDNDELDAINVVVGSPTNTNETLYFSDAYDGDVDLLYNVTSNGNFKQWFILNTPLRDPAVWIEGDVDLVFSSSYTIDSALAMQVDGVPVDRSGEYITANDIWFYDPLIENFTDANDEVVFVIGTPFGYDSAGETIRGETRIRVSGNKAYVEKIFNAPWIQDPSRVYPLFLDASILIDGTAWGDLNAWVGGGIFIPSDDAQPYKERYIGFLKDADYSVNAWYTDDPQLDGGWSSSVVVSASGADDIDKVGGNPFYDSVEDTVYFVLERQMTDDTFWDIEVYKSIDKGESWSYVADIVSDIPYNIKATNMVADEFGRFYVAYTADDYTDSLNVWCYYSDDQGSTWSATGDSTILARESESCQAYAPTYLLYDNTGGLMWFGNTGNTEISIVTSSDTASESDEYGDSWNAKIEIVNYDATGDFTYITDVIRSPVDTDEIVIAIHGELDGTTTGHRETHAKVSQNNGATWGNELDTAVVSANYREFGTLLIGDEGDIILFYTDLATEHIWKRTWDVSANSWGGSSDLTATNDIAYNMGFAASDFNYNNYFAYEYYDQSSDDAYVAYITISNTATGNPEIIGVNITGVSQGGELIGATEYIFHVYTLDSDTSVGDIEEVHLKMYVGSDLYEVEYDGGVWAEVTDASSIASLATGSCANSTVNTYYQRFDFYITFTDDADFDAETSMDIYAWAYDAVDQGYSFGGTNHQTSKWQKYNGNYYGSRLPTVITISDAQTAIQDFNDTDNWYAMYTWYTITANASINTGYDDFDRVFLEIRRDTTRIISLEYDDDLGWSEDYGGTGFNYQTNSLTEGGGAGTGEGYWFIQVDIQILWAFDSTDDYEQDLEYYVIFHDDAAVTDEDYDNDVVDIITGVDVIIGNYGDNQDVNTWWVATGYVTYYNGSTYANSNDFDVSVQYNWNGGGTLDDTSLPEGNWLVTGTVGNFSGTWWINATIIDAPTGMGYTLSANSSVTITITNPVAVTVQGDGVSGEWRQGESVSLDYDPPIGKVVDAEWEGYVSNQAYTPVQEGYLSELITINEAESPYTSRDDGNYSLTITNAAGVSRYNTLIFLFKIQVLSDGYLEYEAYYNYTGGATNGAFNISFINMVTMEYTSVYEAAAFGDGEYNKTGSIAINSTYIDSEGYAFVKFYVLAIADPSETTWLRLDRLIVNRDSISSTIRSEYFVANPEITQHRIVIPNFDYGITINVSHPTHWTFAGTNPDATIVTGTGYTTLSDTVGLPYEILFYANDSLRLGSVGEVWNDGLETTGDEFEVVFEGGSSIYITSEQIVNPPTTATYYVVWSHYLVSGSLYVNGTEYTSTGAWESYCVYFDDLGRLNFTASNAYVDNLRFYQAQMTTSKPSSSILKHLTPYGLYNFQYDTLQGIIFDSTNTLIENDTLTTDSLGVWSNSFASFTSAGTYTLHLWHLVNDFSVTVQQLGFSSAVLNSLTSSQYVLQVTGETYSDQLYNVSLDGVWIATNIGSGELVSAVNVTSGTHSFTVYAVSRDITDTYFVFLEASSSGSYTTFYETVHLSIYSSIDGFGFADWEDLFKVYVNSSRIYESTYFASESVLNITILSYFGATLYKQNHTLTTNELNIPVAVYEQAFGNSGNNPIRYVLTYSGSGETKTIDVYPDQPQIWRVANDSYHLEVFGLYWDNDGNLLQQENVLWTDEIVLDGSQPMDFSDEPRPVFDTDPRGGGGLDEDTLRRVLLFMMTPVGSMAVVILVIGIIFLIAILIKVMDLQKVYQKWGR